MAQSRIVKQAPKPVMLKASDVIRMASTHSHYLKSEQWLCSVIQRMERFEKTVTADESSHATDVIHTALEGSSFLRAKLVHDGVIPRTTHYGSPVYAEAAQQFWKELIIQLQKVNK